MPAVNSALSAPASPAPPASRVLSRSALSARAYSAVKCMILDQQIAPGAHLAVDLLAQSLGISQTPMREALARLEGDGLVVREGNGRLHVTGLLDRDGFEQLYTMRLAIEPLAASLAAAGAAEPELASLRDSIAQMNSAAERSKSASYASFLTADTTFHETIARAGHNRFLADAVHHLHTHHRLAFLYRNRGITDWQDARREHTRIAKAIADRAPERAEQRMRAHIERSRIALRAGFDGAGLTGSASHARPQPTPAHTAS